MNIQYNKKQDAIFINNYKLILESNYYIPNNIIDAIDLYTNKKVKLKIIPIQDINSLDQNYQEAEQKIVTISKVAQIKGEFLTQCQNIIIPQIIYQQNNDLVIPPQFASQVQIEGKVKYHNQIINTQQSNTQYDVNKVINYFQKSYIIVYERADYTLEDAIKQKIDFTLIRQYLYNILQGIYQLHTKHICHNDIKASNCLIFTKNYKMAKLTDFDLSIDLQENQLKNQNLILTNPMYTEEELIDQNDTTIQFASPESQSVLKVQSGYLTDIWQFGQLILYCFTGLQFNISISRNKDDYIFLKQLYGNEFADLVSLCTEAQSVRPSAEILLKHPFFTCHNLDTYKFEFKEYLSQRLFHGSAKQLLRCSSLPSNNILDINNLHKFQSQQKQLLNEITVALRDEVPSEFGTNSDRITELTIQKDNEYKLQRSQSQPYNKIYQQNIQTKDCTLSAICNEDTQYLDNYYLNYFIIDKLNLFQINKDINVSHLQQLLLTINLYILSNAIGLHSYYFTDRDLIIQQSGEYDEYKQKIIKFKSERNYDVSSFLPLNSSFLKQNNRSENSLHSNRLKSNSTQDTSSQLSTKHLQKSFSKSCIQLIENVRKSLLTSQLTASNLTGSSTFLSSKSLENLGFTGPSDRGQKVPQTPVILETTGEKSISKSLPPPNPILQQECSASSINHYIDIKQSDKIQQEDSFDCVQFNMFSLHQNENSQTSNISLSITNQTAGGDSLKPMISVSKTSKTSKSAQDGVVSLHENLFEIPHDVTVEESCSDDMMEGGRIVTPTQRNSSDVSKRSEFILESSDFV